MPLTILREAAQTPTRPKYVAEENEIITVAQSDRQVGRIVTTMTLLYADRAVDLKESSTWKLLVAKLVHGALTTM